MSWFVVLIHQAKCLDIARPTLYCTCAIYKTSFLNSNKKKCFQ